MAYCKANSCYNSKNYSWNDYCSYHEKCLERLRRSYSSSFSNIESLDTFETWFNDNCGWVVTKDYSSSSSYPFYVWIVIYEPSYRSISDDISAIKYDNYSSSSYAEDKAQELKSKLQNSGGWYDTPMLEVHPKANSYEYCSSLITGPYVERKQVGSSTKTVDIPLFFVGYSSSTPSDLDRYFKPLDIVWVKCVDRIVGKRFYHVGIYLGDVGNGDRVCHFSRERNGVRLTSWGGFLSDTTRKIVRYHPTIPFKYPQRIAEQIAWAYSNNFRKGNYNLRNRNCEHFANMCVYGVNYSEQVEDKKEALAASVGVPAGAAVGAMGGLGIFNLVGSIALAPATGGASLLWGAVSTGATGIGVAATVELVDRYSEINNGKGSTIKLTSEMRESSGILREEDNRLSDRIKVNIEVPSKEYCLIM